MNKCFACGSKDNSGYVDFLTNFEGRDCFLCENCNFLYCYKCGIRATGKRKSKKLYLNRFEICKKCEIEVDIQK
jgi:hypothetical protein